jgi:hypothetical protein
MDNAPLALLQPLIAPEQDFLSYGAPKLQTVAPVFTPFQKPQFYGGFEAGPEFLPWFFRFRRENSDGNTTPGQAVNQIQGMILQTARSMTR